MPLGEALEPEFDEEGQIVNFITGELLEDRPEKRHRKAGLRFIREDSKKEENQ